MDEMQKCIISEWQIKILRECLQKRMGERVDFIMHNIFAKLVAFLISVQKEIYVYFNVCTLSARALLFRALTRLCSRDSGKMCIFIRPMIRFHNSNGDGAKW